jgi:hypothetical protein
MKRLTWRRCGWTSEVPFLAVVQLLQHHHRQEHVVFLELEQRGGVVHQHVGVQHVDALASGHHRAVVSWQRRRGATPAPRCGAMAGTVGGGAGHCAGGLQRVEHGLRRGRDLDPAPLLGCGWSGSIRKVLRSMPSTLRPYMFFSWITSNARHSFSSGR